MGNRITMRFATNHRAFDYDWEGLPIKDKMNANIWLTRYHNHLKNGDALDEYRRKELIERYKKMFEGDSKRRECCMDVRYVDMSGSNIQYSIVHAEVEFPAQHAGEALSACLELRLKSWLKLTTFRQRDSWMASEKSS